MSAWEAAGQHVVITGASSGIGAALAEAMAARGARVALVARREDRLREVLERCRAASPNSASRNSALSDPTMVVADLSDLDRIDTLADELLTALDGRIDVLVNNAGVPKRRGVTELTPDDVESVMRINYFSPVRLTLALLPHMIERNHGRIVNVSSMGVHMVAYRVSAYSASKAALEMFTEGLYVELGHTGVRAQVFVPGTTATEFSTDRPGNNPPFPSDPATTASAEEVAAAIIESLGHDDLVRYTSTREETTSATRNADVNAWVRNLRAVFTPES